MIDGFVDFSHESRQMASASKYLDLVLNRSDELNKTDLAVMETNNIILGNGAFTVLVFTLDNSCLSDYPGDENGSRRYKTAVLLQALDELATDRYMHYLASVGGRVACLLCFPQEEAGSERLPGIYNSILDSCRQFRESLEKDYGVQCGYVISGLVFGWRNIRVAYRQCNALIEYFCFLEKPMPEDVFESQRNLSFVEAQDNEALRRAGEAGIEAACAIMSGLGQPDTIPERTMAYLLETRPFTLLGLQSRTVVFCMHMLDKLVAEDYVDRSWLEGFGLIPRLLNCATASRFEQTLEEGLSELTDYAEKRRAFSVSRRIDDIRRYVDEHFFDANLSVTSIAGAFCLSQPLVSVQFKKYAGQSLSDYIHRQRLQMAREIIADTKMPLQEVAQAVGYTSLVTMYRAFRRYEGISPGQLRDSG